MRGIVFVTHGVPKADLDDIPQPYCMVLSLRVFLAALKHGRKLRSVSKCNTNESETINKTAKTLKSQNQAKGLLRYAIRNKSRHESNAAYQISPKPILDANEYAKKEVGGRGGAYKYIYRAI